MKKIAIVFGTRPEIIKLFPVYLELRKSFNCQIIHTGQHSNLAEDQLIVLGIKPFLNLNVMIIGQKQSDVFREISEKFGNYLHDEKPDLVITQGDTATAFITSVLAFSCQIPIAHVEAGLRTFDLSSPFPEEGYRQMISRISTLDFCPTEESKHNLINENIPTKKIYVVGNTVVDTLEWLRKQDLSKSEKVNSLLNKIKTPKIVLVTLHRRENFGQGHIRILNTIKSLSVKYINEISFVFPVHPNPSIKNTVESILSNAKNIFLIEPLSYFDFIFLMKTSCLIISDSGGIQEEAPSFGVKVLVTRDTTERPEGITAGTSILVGTNASNLKRVFENEINKTTMSGSHTNPFGDGKASKRIFKIISKLLNEKNKGV